MKYGICTHLFQRQAGTLFDFAETIKMLGYDYYELSVTELLSLDPAVRRNGFALMNSLSLETYALCSLLPETIRLLEAPTPERDVKAYLERMFEIVAPLNASICVFGSPWAKRRPATMSEAEGYARLSDFCRMLGDAAAPYGMTAVIEPNCSLETNFIRRYDEAVRLAKLAAHPNVKCLVDYYHLRIEDETSDDLSAGGPDLLRHVHVARFSKRSFPSDLSEDENYTPFFDVIDSLGYTGGVSVEARLTDLSRFSSESAAALSFLKRTRKR